VAGENGILSELKPPDDDFDEEDEDEPTGDEKDERALSPEFEAAVAALILANPALTKQEQRIICFTIRTAAR
jgi:hypothetical protein